MTQRLFDVQSSCNEFLMRPVVLLPAIVIAVTALLVAYRKQIDEAGERLTGWFVRSRTGRREQDVCIKSIVSTADLARVDIADRVLRLEYIAASGQVAINLLARPDKIAGHLWVDRVEAGLAQPVTSRPLKDLDARTRRIVLRQARRDVPEWFAAHARMVAGDVARAA